MYCPYCGAKNPDHVAFCSACGSSLKLMQPKVQENPEKNVSYETQAVFQENVQTGQDGQEPKAAFELNAPGENYSQNYQQNQNYRRNGYDTEPYQPGQGQNFYQQHGYGQNPYGQGSYGQNSYGQDSYSQGGYRQNTFGQDYYSQDPYDQDHYGQNGYDDFSGSYHRAKEKPSRLPMIVSLVEAGLSIVALLVIVLFVGGMFTPEKTAERYFVYAVNGEYDNAFEMLDLDESDFVNEDSFEKYWKLYDFSELDEYEVGEASSEEVEETEDQSEQEDGKKKNSKKKTQKTEYADVEITYQDADSLFDNFFSVRMKKNSSGKYLFFEDWMILPENILVHDIALDTPEQAFVTLDGVALGDKLKQETESGGTRFVIPELFAGKHTIEIQAPGYLDYIEEIILDHDGEEYLCSMKYDESLISQLEELAAANMKLIYATAAKGGSFSEISNLLTQDPDAQANLKAEYEELVHYFEDHEIVEIRFRQIHAYSNNRDTEISMEYSYEIDYNQTDVHSNSRSMQSVSDSDSYDVEFVQEGDSWVQKNLGCKPLYF